MDTSQKLNVDNGIHEYVSDGAKPKQSRGTMLDVSALYTLSYSFLLAVVCYLVLTRFSRGEKKFSFSPSFGEKPYVRYRQDSRLCKQLASACSTLERYEERGRRGVREK